MTEAISTRVGERWTKDVAPAWRRRLQSSPLIWSYMNERTCGEPLTVPNAGLHALLKSRLAGRRLRSGISVGGGAGVKEMQLLRAGLIDHVTVVEPSHGRIELGRRLAREAGLESRIQFVHGNAFTLFGAAGQFDLVHWNASLHHMLDVRSAVRWSRELLASGGWFYFSEYVGPNHLQYTDRMLDAASAIRALLPGRYRARSDGKEIPVRCQRLPLRGMIERDPSECVDAESILPAVRDTFPQAEIAHLGGIGHMIALAHVYANFDESREEDRLWLRAVLHVDGLLADQGLSIRATGLASKQGG